MSSTRVWGWSAGTILALAIALGFVFFTPEKRAEADQPYLYFPAQAGSVWNICCGYNTETHTDVDPYAIDLVRLDAETANSPVLSPVSGTINGTTSGSSCITIRDPQGILVMMCHVFPVPGLTRGSTVAPGQQIGTVAPAGEAMNNGLAHIHLALHTDFNAGHVQTIPFTGAYALEGIELPAVTTYNAYAGQRFTASLPILPPPAPPTPTPARTSTPRPTATAAPTATVRASSVQVVPNSTYVRGLNNIVIMGADSVGAISSRIAADSGRTVSALWLYTGNTWKYYLPATPSLNGGLTSLGAAPSNAFVVLT